MHTPHFSLAQTPPFLTHLPNIFFCIFYFLQSHYSSVCSWTFLTVTRKKWNDEMWDKILNVYCSSSRQLNCSLIRSMWQIVLPRLLCTGLVLGMSGCLVSGQDSPSLPDIKDGQFIDDCVKMHNSVRSTVKDASDMLYMVRCEVTSHTIFIKRGT